jgi:repressor LexA
MLLPPNDAADFLRTYKEMLTRVAGHELKSALEFIDARRAFFECTDIANPPTDDKDLLLGLKEAVFGKFVVARHLARHTKFISAQNSSVYCVRGVTTELEEIAPVWTMVETAVMKFRGYWICDGLISALKIHIGPGMKREFLEMLRSKGKRSSESTQDPEKSRGFTPKQGQYLTFIYYYTKINRQPPAEADMVRYFRVSAPSVHQMVVTMEERGLITRTPGKGRSIVLAIPKEELPDLE